jgi:hypothetical protein
VEEADKSAARQNSAVTESESTAIMFYIDDSIYFSMNRVHFLSNPFLDRRPRISTNFARFIRMLDDCGVAKAPWNAMETHHEQVHTG